MPGGRLAAIGGTTGTFWGPDATTTDEAFLFSATTQTYYDNVNGSGDSRPGSRNIADDSGNSRGLGNVDRTRNYFRTTIETDAYNTERFSLVSGANAVQFGLGGAAVAALEMPIPQAINRPIRDALAFMMRLR